jgi:hypothetical protein
MGTVFPTYSHTSAILNFLKQENLNLKHGYYIYSASIARGQLLFAMYKYCSLHATVLKYGVWE